MADGKPGRRAKGTINGKIIDQRSELSERLVKWNPLDLTLSAAELAEAYDDLTNTVFGHLMRGGAAIQLQALLANWLRGRAGRTTPAVHHIADEAEAITRWWLAAR